MLTCLLDSSSPGLARRPIMRKRRRKQGLRGMGVESFNVVYRNEGYIGTSHRKEKESTEMVLGW